MEFADLASLIKSRRSIRRWQDRKVSKELLLQAIDLATWAPNAGNQQNWHFYIILDRDTINAIADAVQASADRIASWPEAKKFGDDATRWREKVGFFRNAPAAIAVTTSRYQSLADRILAAREKTDSYAARMRRYRRLGSSHIQSVASAIAYLLLILHQMGLGTVWMTGPMQAKGEIEKILKTPPDTDLAAFIPVGYPAESPAPRERRPAAEVCEVIK